MKQVIIVVPVYKSELSVTESISITQLFNVLWRHDICLIAPERLEIRYKELLGKKFKIKRFPNKYFENTKGYSNLLLDELFYGSFIEYEYMLIYQLDAFVFSDRLLEFCNMDYDYWGAEVPKSYWRHHLHRVGNGGFSLRRISSMMNILSEKERIISFIEERIPEYDREELYANEDEFIIYGAENIDHINIKLPDHQMVHDFSIEYNLDGIYNEVKEKIPFGCHRWDRYRFGFWWELIKPYGFMIDQSDYTRLASYTHNYEKWVATYYVQFHKDTLAIKTIGAMVKSDKVSVWGGGKMLPIYKRCLENLGKRIEYIYDKAIGRDDVVFPSCENIAFDCNSIIVTSSKYDKEICDELDKMGKKRGTDYYSWNDLAEELVNVLEINVYGETNRVRDTEFNIKL